MSGVFLSYSRSDRAFVEQIIRGLRAVGVEVWWDEDMPGVDWQDELERQISELVGVVVLWTEHSTASSNVRDEARLGLKIGKLINVLSGVPEPPFPFDRVNGLPLDGWDGLQPHHGWTRLVQTVEALVVRAGGCQVGDITGAQTRREQALRDQQDALARAQTAFQNAQIREGEAGEAAKTAGVALTRAEDDMGRVGEMRVSLTILRSAQQELEAAREAKLAADEGLRAARARLSNSSIELARLKADMDRLMSEAVKPAGPAAERPQHAPNVLHVAAERLAETETVAPLAVTPDPIETKPSEPTPPSPPSPPSPPPTPPAPPAPPPTPTPPVFDQTTLVTSAPLPWWRRPAVIVGGVAGAVVVLLIVILLASRHPRPAPEPVIPGSGSPDSSAVDSAAPAASGSADAFSAAPPAANTDSIAGTTWQGVYTWSTGEVEDETDTFRPDGVLVYSYKGNTYDNGHWSQVGDTINWDSNNHYADGVGQLQGAQITGAMTNIVKATGTFTLTRQP